MERYTTDKKVDQTSHLMLKIEIELVCSFASDVSSFGSALPC